MILLKNHCIIIQPYDRENGAHGKCIASEFSGLDGKLVENKTALNKFLEGYSLPPLAKWDADEDVPGLWRCCYESDINGEPKDNGGYLTDIDITLLDMGKARPLTKRAAHAIAEPA